MSTSSRMSPIVIVATVATVLFAATTTSTAQLNSPPIIAIDSVPVTSTPPFMRPTAAVPPSTGTLTPGIGDALNTNTITSPNGIPIVVVEPVLTQLQDGFPVLQSGLECGTGQFEGFVPCHVSVLNNGQDLWAGVQQFCVDTTLFACPNLPSALQPTVDPSVPSIMIYRPKLGMVCSKDQSQACQTDTGVLCFDPTTITCTADGRLFDIAQHTYLNLRTTPVQNLPNPSLSPFGPSSETVSGGTTGPVAAVPPQPNNSQLLQPIPNAPQPSQFQPQVQPIFNFQPVQPVQPNAVTTNPINPASSREPIPLIDALNRPPTGAVLDLSSLPVAEPIITTTQPLV